MSQLCRLYDSAPLFRLEFIFVPAHIMRHRNSMRCYLDECHSCRRRRTGRRFTAAAVAGPRPARRRTRRIRGFRPRTAPLQPGGGSLSQAGFRKFHIDRQDGECAPMKTINHGEPPSQTRSPLFLIGRNHQGQWVVQDQGGIRGGLFVDREAALRYVRAECGYQSSPPVVDSGIFELELGRAAAVTPSQYAGNVAQERRVA